MRLFLSRMLEVFLAGLGMGVALYTWYQEREKQRAAR